MRKLLTIVLCSAALISCGGPEEDGNTPATGNGGGAQANSGGPGAVDSGPAMPEVQPGQLRNVLLVTFDTTRADHIACYGSENSSTPTLDYLASTGVRFEQCFAPAPITLPSHASLFTGQYPYNHGVRNNGTHKLPDQAVTLAERLQENGYDTGAVISAMVLHDRYGVGQGFDHYDQNLAAGSFKNVYMARETPAADTIKRAKQWVGQRGDKPFFLWVHLFDPHHPYAPPPEYVDRVNGNPYDGELAYADEQLGQLLVEMQKMDVLRHTLVVATGDHGESLGEHGESTHSIFIYDSTVRVPLIFSHSQVRQNEVRSAAVSLVDIAPTVLDMLQLPALDDADGQSLAVQLTADQTQPEAVALEEALMKRVVYSESLLPYYNFGWAALRSLRSFEGRYIQAPMEELYGSLADPGELMNLIDQSPDQADVFRRLLADAIPANEADHKFSNLDDLPPAEKAALIALGYLTSSDTGASTDGDVGPPYPNGDRPDPKEAILYLSEQADALELARNHNPEAEAALRAVLEENPEEMRCLSALADILVETNRLEEALPMVRRLAQMRGAGAMEILALAQLEHRMGMPEWEEHFAAARAVDPNDPAPLIFLGDRAGQTQDWEEAVGFYDEALKLDPGNLIALLQKGVTQFQAKQLKKARVTLEEALSINPDIYQLQLQLGLLSDAQQAFEESLAFFERATQLGPGRRMAWRRYGSTLLRFNRPKDAVKAFQTAFDLGDPTLVTAKNLGMLNVSFNQPAKAVAPLKKAVELAPNDWQVNLFLAVALDLRADEAGAKQHLSKARQLSAESVNQLAQKRKDVAALLEKYPQ